MLLQYCSGGLAVLTLCSPAHRYVDDVISRIGRLFPDMTIELFRPNGTSAVLLVVEHAFKQTHCPHIFRPGDRYVCLTCLPPR